MKNQQHSVSLRTRLIFLCVCLFAIAIVVQLVNIQWVQGVHWRKISKEANLAYLAIPATRGNILTSDGSLLSTSLPYYRVAMDPCVVDPICYKENIASLCINLAKFYKEKSPSYYRKLLDQARKSKKRYVLLSKQWVNHEKRKFMLAWPIFNKNRFKGGVLFEKTERRYRPFQNLAKRTVGSINEDWHGTGLEYTFRRQLQGVEGRALHQKTLGGNWKMLYKSNGKEPINGYDIETTLDINLQDIAHQSLLNVLQESEAQYGCALLMEVKTGAIRAMVNLSRTESGTYEEQYNYAIGNQGTTEPGSTFKLVSLLALLEETGKSLSEQVETGNGKLQFCDRLMRDSKEGGYGKITIQEIFEKSSNVGVSLLITEVFKNKPGKFLKYIEGTGIASSLDFQMTGAGEPMVPHPGDPGWSNISLPWLSIGYGLKVSPLQTLSIYNAIANEGKLVQPQIVQYIKSARNIYKQYTPKILRHKICSDSTLSKLKLMLEGVVERGTAKGIRHSVYKLAGKTGTANKVVNGGGYSKDTYASFVGYFPAENPRYSVMVVVDSPKGVNWHYGGNIAPVFKDIADKIAARDITQSIKTCIPESCIAFNPYTGSGNDLKIISQELGLTTQPKTTEWGTWIDNGQHCHWQALKVEDDKVPWVVGMLLRDALYLLEKRGMKVIIQGHPGGQVQSQSVLSRAPITQGMEIVLQMSRIPSTP